MVGKLLLRGMLIGILAGMLAVGFGKLFGEPSVDQAIAFEDTVAQAKGEPAEPEVFSRRTQSGIGLLTGGVMYGAGLGGFFALAFVLAYRRIGSFSPRVTSVLVAAGAFTVLTLVPLLKYPANPPSVGDPDTIGYRTALFFVLLAISVGSMILSVAVTRRLRPQHGDWASVLIGCGLFTAVIVLACAGLPAINEVPEAFPATLLWNFRIASLGMQAIVWTTLGLLFGWMAEPVLAASSARSKLAYS